MNRMPPTSYSIMQTAAGPAAQQKLRKYESIQRRLGSLVRLSRAMIVEALTTFNFSGVSHFAS